MPWQMRVISDTQPRDLLGEEPSKVVVTFDHSRYRFAANILSRDRYSKVEVSGCYAREPG
jgi:hypothetical protein